MCSKTQGLRLAPQKKLNTFEMMDKRHCRKSGSSCRLLLWKTLIILFSVALSAWLAGVKLGSTGIYVLASKTECRLPNILLMAPALLWCLYVWPGIFGSKEMTWSLIGNPPHVLGGLLVLEMSWSFIVLGSRSVKSKLFWTG